MSLHIAVLTFARRQERATSRLSDWLAGGAQRYCSRRLFPTHRDRRRDRDPLLRRPPRSPQHRAELLDFPLCTGSTICTGSNTERCPYELVMR